MDTQTNPGRGARTLVGVDAEQLNELTHRYALYRTAMAGPWDPVKSLALTGDVLRAVQRLTTAGARGGAGIGDDGPLRQ
ncbi:hypothetical protein J2Y41_003924 [Arthrobacter sp. 1088]|uniref:hypothetical protein n=1 Tax=Arthrobacter sp. 1088 TaxID=2817768 RepID=UPI0028621698|nr:hypothetical protein [Arthrobacter sp. 1088]MDR6688338.1 hypothetical protein [Arthrobacter sp. 1088]